MQKDPLRSIKLGNQKQEEEYVCMYIFSSLEKTKTLSCVCIHTVVSSSSEDSCLS